MQNSNPHIINNVFSKSDIKYINSRSLDIMDNLNELPTNSKLWEFDIIEYSNDVFIHQIQPTDSIYNLIRKKCISIVGYPPKGFLFYYWTAGSYIPWHTDKNYSFVSTVYLNKDWNVYDGGLFQYIDSKKNVNTITPKYNSWVGQYSGLPHSTTITNSNTPIRRTLQIFFENKITNSIL